ncbi:MAG: hypothetical protein H6737_29525 [Alphaproteobacteria bacterium]|nr:hypothetical protein [Alphaproteobacteria bacterium]
MLLWMALASAARPLYVQPEDDGHFRVVDHTGQNVGAWHFAHATRDRRKVGQLRWRLYFRRTSAIVCLGAGAIAFAGASVAIASERRLNGELDPTLGVYGVVAAGGLLAAVVHPTNVVRKRPDWLRVDENYTMEEAVERIQRRRQVEIWAAPNGIYARF